MPLGRVWAWVVACLAAAGPLCAQQPDAVAVVAKAPAVRAALDAAREREPEVLADQVRFCEVAAPPFGEAARGELLRRTLASLGLRNVRVDAVGNVIAERPGLAAHPHVVLAAHLDTVFPEGTPVQVTRRGTQLRGPGIADNCRGLAVLVGVARRLEAARVQTQGPISFVANVGEEGLGDLRGVKALFRDTLKGRVDQFVAIDNAGLSISTVGVGSLRYRVTFKGPGGHSYVEFGRPNPAAAVGRAAARIEELRVPGSPHTTFNVGRIGGGTSVNAIPEEAWMEIDLRSTDRAALAELDAHVRKVIEQAAVDENARWQTRALTVKIERVGDRPAGAVGSEAPIVRAARAAARALGFSAGLNEASSDANLPMSLGIPAIAIGGGGQSSGSHTTGEWFESSGSYLGTQHALLLVVALAQR